MEVPIQNPPLENKPKQLHRFGPGNKFGKGNPHLKRIAALRASVIDAVTKEDIKSVILKLKEMALDGDVVAAKEFLDRCIGKAAQATPDMVQAIQINVGMSAPRPVATVEAINVNGRHDSTN